MLDMSLADILKILGKWTESTKFTNEVARRLKISQRQAYRLIKKDNQILKLVLTDRTVLYGLAEFGLPIKKETEAEKPKGKALADFLDTLKKFEKRRLEGKETEEDRIHKQAANDMELLAKLYPFFEPLKDFKDSRAPDNKEKRH
jgi:nucleoid DNA-binding protein